MKKLSLVLLLCSSLLGVEAGNATELESGNIAAGETAAGAHLLGEGITVYPTFVTSSKDIVAGFKGGYLEKDGFKIDPRMTFADLAGAIRAKYPEYDPSTDQIFLSKDKQVTADNFTGLLPGIKNGDALYIVVAPANPAVPK